MKILQAILIGGVLLGQTAIITAPTRTGDRHIIGTHDLSTGPATLTTGQVAIQLDPGISLPATLTTTAGASLYKWESGAIRPLGAGMRLRLELLELRQEYLDAAGDQTLEDAAIQKMLDLTAGYSP